MSLDGGAILVAEPTRAAPCSLSYCDIQSGEEAVLDGTLQGTFSQIFNSGTLTVQEGVYEVAMEFRNRGKFILDGQSRLTNSAVFLKTYRNLMLVLRRNLLIMRGC
jgi:hypothetical protein